MVVILLIRGVKWAVKKGHQKYADHKDAKLQEEHERDVQEFERARPEPFVIERVHATNPGDVVLDLTDETASTGSSSAGTSSFASTSASASSSSAGPSSLRSSPSFRGSASVGSISYATSPAVPSSTGTLPSGIPLIGSAASVAPEDEGIDAETIALARSILRERSRQQHHHRNPKQASAQAEVAAEAERALEAIDDDLPPPAYEEAVAMPAPNAHVGRSTSASTRRRPLPQPGSSAPAHASSLRY